MTSAPKKKAPVRLTGNTGARYENEVAGRFLLDMLLGTNSVGPGFGHVERMDWQARDSGWLLDDLLVVCRADDGSTRSIGFSYKSNRQITRNGFPDDFVDLAWGQWLGVTAAEHATVLARLKDTYERAFTYWGATPLVVSQFASFVILPGPSQFLLSAIRWLLPAIGRFDAYDWKHGVEEGLIDFLGACWAQKRDEISSDPDTREAFLKLLAIVTARGSPAAIALSRRIAG